MTRAVFVEGSVFSGKKQSGIAYATANFVEALADDMVNDLRITVLLARDTAHVPENIAQRKDIRFVRMPFSARMVRLLARLPLTLPLDLLYGRGAYIFPNYYNLSLLRSRSLTFVHDVAFLLFPDSVQAKNRQFLTTYVPRWVQRADQVMTISEASKQEIVQQLHVPAAKVSVAYVPLFADRFRRVSSEPKLTKLRQKYNLPQQYVLYMGNLEPRKNVTVLVTAFAASKAAKNGVSLVLAGADAWNQGEITKAIDAARQGGADVVIPHTRVSDEDLPGLFSAAQCLVQPSLHEGFGIAPTQALACKTPVVASDIPVMREVLGSAATYFDPNSAVALTRALDDTLTHRITSEPARDKVLAKLAPAAVAKQLLSAVR